MGLPFGPSYRIPKRLEASHILMMGDTGSGKSNAIRQLLRQVRERGESAIVYDPAMDFVSEFYSPARGDLILNPLDARCPYWGLGDEINRDETATTIAAAFLPEKEYEKKFFTDGRAGCRPTCSRAGRSQFTAPADDLKVANRELGTVEAIGPDGRLSLKMDGGRDACVLPALG